MHDGCQIFGYPFIFWLCVTIGNFINGEKYLWIRPCITVGRSLQKGLRWWNVFSHFAAQVLDIKFTIPIGHHRLVIVCPAVAVRYVRILAVGSHNLNVVHTNYRRKLSVVVSRIGKSRACIMDFVLCRELICRYAKQHPDKKYKFRFFHLDCKSLNAKIMKFYLTAESMVVVESVF